MKVSVCITVFNEEKSVGKLLESLLDQTKNPDEIVIVDGGSKDKSVEIISHLQKKDGRIKLLVQKCSRAKGRNLGVELAKNETIAMTDADCVADKHWLKRITDPFKIQQVDIVAGFYKMITQNPMQKAASVFLGVTPNSFDVNFLPSTRSIAFRKIAWEVIGGFPEKKGNSAEDTDFNYKAVKLGMKFARVKNAIVEWEMPKTLKETLVKIYNYAKWDAKYGVWWHPTHKFSSHNIKVLLVLLRYFLGLLFFILGFKNSIFMIVLLGGMITYVFWAFKKVYSQTGDGQAGLWGVVVQIGSDFAVMAGFLAGIMKR